MSKNLTMTSTETEDSLNHIHAAGCADLKRRYDKHVTMLNCEHKTLKDLIEDEFADFLSDDPSMSWRAYDGFVRVFPCVGSLPME